MLYIHEIQTDRSRAETQRQLKSHFYPEEEHSLSNFNRIMVLVYWSVAKFKSLASNTKQFDEFAGICEETFLLDHAAAESQLGTSSQDPAALAPGTCLQEPTDPVPGTSSQDPAEQAPGTSSQDPAVLAPGTSAQASGEPRSSQALDPVTPWFHGCQVSPVFSQKARTSHSVKPS